MGFSSVRVTEWASSGPPEYGDIEVLLRKQGLAYYGWSNSPGDRYPVHTHPYHKIIYVVDGSITLGLPDEGRSVTLAPGDRLDLPAGTAHDAVVGPQGVFCLEAHVSPDQV
jgi:quercetin dioxygenase-like cupin family protein